MEQRQTKLALTRRSALLGLGAASLLSASAWAAKNRPPEKADVIVVGAGLSGLNAAMTLAGEGLKVIVLEADVRSGGRIRTLYGAPLSPDAGGSEVGPLYARARDLCSKLNVGLGGRLRGGAGMAIFTQGRLIDPKTWAAAPENNLAGALHDVLPFSVESRLMEKADRLDSYEAWLDPAHALGGVPYGDYLRHLGADDAALRFASVAAQLDTLNQQSALWALRRDYIRRQSAGQGPVEYVKGGMSKLTDAMAASLGDAVRLKADVAAISQTKTGVVVRTRDGRRFAANQVVLTTPLSVINRIAFDPAPPAAVKAAWAAVPYGRATSVFLPLKSRFWEEDGLPASTWSDTMPGRAFYQANDSGEYIWFYASGALGRPVQTTPMPDVAQFAMAELAKARPASVGRVEKGAAFCWARHPFAMATFAARAPGNLGKLQTALKQPMGRVHFAGEHTADLAAGIEGALESGERVAIEVLSAA
jgi:monoamine oxidase